MIVGIQNPDKLQLLILKKLSHGHESAKLMSGRRDICSIMCQQEQTVSTCLYRRTILFLETKDFHNTLSRLEYIYVYICVLYLPGYTATMPRLVLCILPLSIPVRRDNYYSVYPTGFPPKTISTFDIMTLEFPTI